MLSYGIGKGGFVAERLRSDHMERVLIIGGGGREHAIGWKLYGEGHEVHAAPGNPGIALFAKCVDLDVKNHQAVARYVKDNAIDFTVVGPEAPLADGIVDTFNNLNIPIFGPTARAAEIETSKAFCCKLLSGAGVPIPETTEYLDFESMWSDALDKVYPYVIKYDRLFTGKGVVVVRSIEDEVRASHLFFNLDGKFLIQECEEGPELSFFVLTDGDDFLFLGSAQDYKPLYPGGPNTGGMGGFSPHPILTAELKEQIKQTIVRPTIKAMRKAGRDYTGVMYFQIMITKRGPVVIEINCRFGDPEAQLLMPLLDCELLTLLQATTRFGFLRFFEARFKPEVAVGIVMASEGYPDKPRTGRVIEGVEIVIDASKWVHVFLAGTKAEGGRLLTAGGRVLVVVGLGRNYKHAKYTANEGVSMIKFDGEYHRTDIADEVIQD